MLPSGTATPDSGGPLERVAHGDADAMRECIDAFGALVWGIVLRRVRDHSSAEDLVQEIFTDIWKHAARYDSMIANESAFIGMIARRKVIDWLRKQARLPGMIPLEEMSDVPASTLAGGSVCLDRDLILRVVSEMPEETRLLFCLHFEQGMTHSEISKKTGLPLGSVKTRLRRGLLDARTLVARLGAGVNPTFGELA